MARNGKVPGSGDGCLNVTAKCLLAGDVAEAEKWLDAMESASKTAASKVFYHSLIHSCAQAGNPEAAGWCVERMSRRSLKANLVTFNSVIDACARVGNVALAARWFDEMCRANLRPNGITYNTMIKACARAHDPARAQLWLRRMQEGGLYPCIVSFSTVIDALAKTGDVHRAEECFQQMERAGVEADAVLFNTLINVCAKAMQPDRAEDWLRRMRARGLQADEKTYSSLLNAFARVGDVGRAEHWFNEMQLSGCGGDKMIFGCLVHACCKAGDCARAEFWVEEMRRRGMQPNLFCLNTLLQACARDSDTDRAARCFAHLLATGEADQASYHSMIEVLAGAGDLTSAERWLQKMAHDGFAPNHLTFNALVRGCSACANPPVDDPTQWAYEAILQVYCQKANAPMMRQWFCKMLAAGAVPRPAVVDECARVAHGSGQPALAAEIRKMAAAAARALDQQPGARDGGPSQRGGGPKGGCRSPGPASGGGPLLATPGALGAASLSLCGKRPGSTKMPSASSTTLPTPARTQDSLEPVFNTTVSNQASWEEDPAPVAWTATLAPPSAEFSPICAFSPAEFSPICAFSPAESAVPQTSLQSVLVGCTYAVEQQRALSIQRLSF